MGGSRSASGASRSGRAGSQPAATRVGRSVPTGRALPVPAGSCSDWVISPLAGRKPDRLAAPPRSGSATNWSPTDARVTLAPSPPGGATGLTGIDGGRLAGPNRSSTVMPSARDSANATRRDGSDRPDSTLETACRDTPAILATAYWDSSRAWRTALRRAPVVVSCASVTLHLPAHRASCGRPPGPVCCQAPGLTQLGSPVSSVVVVPSTPAAVMLMSLRLAGELAGAGSYQGQPCPGAEVMVCFTWPGRCGRRTAEESPG